MTTSIVLSLLSYLVSLAALAAAVAYAAWSVWPHRAGLVDSYGPYALWISVQLFGLQILLRAGTALCALVIFAGPEGRFSDHLSVVLKSRSGLLALSTGVTSICLVSSMRYLVGVSRPFVIVALALVMLVLDTLVLKRIGRIARISRSRAYFEGMSEPEKAAADRAWPLLPRPSFPRISDIESAEDAHRYARRAKDIAEAHVWTGAGLIVIFAAFIGSTISASWEKPGLPTAGGLYLVLGAVALGFWLQRRARSYRALSSDFMSRAEDLRIESAQAESALRSPKQSLARFLRQIKSLIVTSEEI